MVRSGRTLGSGSLQLQQRPKRVGLRFAPRAERQLGLSIAVWTRNELEPEQQSVKSRNWQLAAEWDCVAAFWTTVQPERAGRWSQHGEQRLFASRLRGWRHQSVKSDSSEMV